MDKKAKKSNDNTNKRDITTLIIVTEAIVIVILGIALAMLAGRSPVVVTSFQECRTAFGSEVIETKTWTRVERACDINGVRFYERDMNVSSDNDRRPEKGTSERSEMFEEEDFVGLTEREAKDKAKAADTPIRVLERDGQPLPATMDLREGRVNLYINDGVVTKVWIESARGI